MIAVAFVLFAAVTPAPPSPLPMPYPILVNGQRFANATMINGVLVFRVDELANSQLAVESHGAIVRFRPGRQKPGKIRIIRDVSARAVRQNGFAYVPLSDVVKALGGTLTINPATLHPGQPIVLNIIHQESVR